MVMVLTQFSFSFFYIFPFGKKSNNTNPELLFALSHSWLPINPNSRYGDDSTCCPGAKSDGVAFGSSISYQQKRYLCGGDCQRTIVQLSLIKPGNNDSICTRRRRADFTIKIPVCIRTHSPVMVFSSVSFCFSCF